MRTEEPMSATDFELGFELGACRQPLPADSGPELERGHSAGQLARLQAVTDKLERARALERLRRGPPITVERTQAVLRAFQAGELRR